MISTGLPYLQFSMNFSLARLTWPAYDDGRKRENVDVPWSLVLRNLTFDGKVCLRDDKNAAFV